MNEADDYLDLQGVLKIKNECEICGDPIDYLVVDPYNEEMGGEDVLAAYCTECYNREVLDV